MAKYDDILNDVPSNVSSNVSTNKSSKYDNILSDDFTLSNTKNDEIRSIPRPPESLGESIGGGALAVANGLTGGLLPQISGLSNRFGENAKNNIEDWTNVLKGEGSLKDAIMGRPGDSIASGAPINFTKDPKYIAARDNTAAVLADTKDRHPITSEINSAGGTLTGPVKLATSVVSNLGRIVAPIVGNALVGGGTTATQQNWDNPAQALGNTAIGTGIGAATGLIPGALGVAGDAMKSGINKVVTAAQPASKVLDSPAAGLGMKAADFLDKYKMLPNDLNKQVGTAKQLMDDPTGKLAEMAKNGISGLVRGKTNLLGMHAGIPPVVTDKVAKKFGDAVGAGTMKAGSFAADHASRSATYAPLSAWLSGKATEGMDDSEKRNAAMQNQVVKKEDQ
jgi:hypothetical protein